MEKKSWIVLAVGGALAVPVTIFTALTMIFMSIGVAPGGISAVLAACLPASSTSTPYDGSEDGVWALKFLHSKGLRGEPLRVMWAITMRESGGNPNVVAAGQLGSWRFGENIPQAIEQSGVWNGRGYTYPYKFDTGLFQINTVHYNNVTSTLGFSAGMKELIDPDKAFTWMALGSSSNDKDILDDLTAWGISSWDNPVMDASDYAGTSFDGNEDEWIWQPFKRYYDQFPEAASLAGLSSSTASGPTVVNIPKGPSAPNGPYSLSAPSSSVSVLANGSAPVAADAEATIDARTVSPRRVISRPEAPAAQTITSPSGRPATLSGYPLLEPGDPELVSFQIEGRELRMHSAVVPLFTAFLQDWQASPALGRGRLSVAADAGGYVDSYEKRKARMGDGWSDHGGYAIDIRYDVLPLDVNKHNMTAAETLEVRRLLEKYPQIGWGGDYSVGYIDEMHFYLKPNADLSQVPTGQAANAAFCVTNTAGGAIGVNPGSTQLPSEDEAVPQFGFTVNRPGGRNMTYYAQGDPRWATTDGYNMAANGCGTTTMAMIISTLAGKPGYTPADAYKEQRALNGIPSGGGSYTSVFAKMASNHGISGTYYPGSGGGAISAEYWDAIDKTLQAGGLVALSTVAGGKVWSGGPHIIVIRGKAADGRYMVADPAGGTAANRTVSAGFERSDFRINSSMVTFVPSGAVV